MAVVNDLIDKTVRCIFCDGAIGCGCWIVCGVCKRLKLKGAECPDIDTPEHLAREKSLIGCCCKTRFAPPAQCDPGRLKNPCRCYCHRKKFRT